MLSRHAPLLVVLALGLAVLGCQKFKGPQEEEKKAAPKKVTDGGGASEQEATPNAAEEAEKAATFGEKSAAVVSEIAKGTRACIDDFVSAMDMKQIEDGLLPVDVNQMDKTCKRPIDAYKRDGRPLEGRHPVLDAYLEQAATFSDHYLRLSFRLRQIGARERWKVLKDIDTHRLTLVQTADRLDQGAAEVGSWPPETGRDTEVRPEDLSAETYRARARELVDWMGERLPKMVAAYDEYGFRPADIQQSIYFFSLRFPLRTTSRWLGVGEKRFQALTCVGNEKTCTGLKDKMTEMLAAAHTVVDTYEKGVRFYRGGYHSKLDEAEPIRQELRKALKDFQPLVKQSRL